ncbi:hypothetical protein HRI_000796600 [Hibiscus trionum]|uniref:Uncharacterized protein n=1 Tax=Hibiscus trionum TaxID=183268 RepID=A0A9W7H6E0_HIBTR|nr:hypothetical protein HRI_000796600 [Hibiscus trionum]
MERFPGFVLLLLVVICVSSPLVSAARPLSILPEQQRYSKMFATLGVVCECCDGSGGECSTTWTQPCSKLNCLPWKLH